MPAVMECPDANELQALMAGQLAAAARAKMTEHLDGCAECRGVVASLARGAEAAAPEMGLEATLAPMQAAMLEGALTATLDSGSSVEATRSEHLRAGAKIGRYVISGRLGAGAMGVVYSASDPELGREVALKLLKRPDPMLGDRLGREARAMAKVSHPNVVAVYDVGTVDDQVYVAMELVRGQTLRQWQAAARRTPSELVEVYAAAGRGLAAAHAAGVVHRDFKPDNVLIGEDGRPRVTDFGLAIGLAKKPSSGSGPGSGAGSGPGSGSGSGPAASSASASSTKSFDISLTQTGALLGTPVYMSPEQFEGGNIDPRSDQWAFCVSLHEALFGGRPFTGATSEELRQRVTTGAIAPSGAARSAGVSPALRRIVHRGLAVRPGDRHATMNDLIAELGRDRGRPWRRAALACGSIAAVFAVGLAADALLRQRAEEATTQTFRATGGQLERSVALRYESFVALADASYSVPVMHQVLGHKDQADFGFGDQGADSENLSLVHDALASADWISWAQRSSRATIAVGDYKGRLLFTSADPGRWGADLLVLSAAGAAFDAASGGAYGGAMVARYDDPRVAAAQLYGPAVPAGLAVLFARALVVGGVPLGLFVQAIDGRQLLADVSVGDDVLLSLVAPDGSAVGRAPAAATGVAPGRGIAEVRAGGQLYLVQGRPLQGLDGSGGAAGIATLVLARQIDPGLSGLFPGARAAFSLAALLLLVGAVAAGLRARALSLIRG
jgi:predicted Ser/Thr protein kinase